MIHGPNEEKKCVSENQIMIELKQLTTVDGRNSAPVDMVDIPLFTGFHTCLVVQDFFHQQ